MIKLKRLLVSTTLVAVTAGLMALPMTAAEAAPADQAACVAAQRAEGARAAEVHAAKAKVAKAKKLVKKAKKSARPATVKKAKVRKAKKAVTKAKSKLHRAKAAHATARQKTAKACAEVPASPAGNQLGQLLALLSQSGAKSPSLPGGIGGANGAPVDAAQLTNLLAVLGGGQLPALDAGLLAGITEGFGMPLDAGLLSELLGGALDPAQITSLLSGGADPAMLLEVFKGIAGQFGALGGGALPIPTDPMALFTLFRTGLDALVGHLDPAALGSVLRLFTQFAQLAGGDTSTLPTLGVEQLKQLLTGFLPAEVIGALDPTDLLSLLGGFNNLPTSPEQVLALFGGLLSPAQLEALLTGSADASTMAVAFGDLLKNFSVLTDLELPGGVDLGVLTGLIDNVVSLVTDLLGGLLGGGPTLPIPEIPIVCDILPLPILCK
ncbi:hypothetical protein [Nocardioides daejeonensis]|uniref:hypothetical protein n=1 Tax=Nocardioides daejeonensis TaxID=1046556 RepID=UPI000D74F02B|nr:hypothetical protein [Nocardioides daejeonensis]